MPMRWPPASRAPLSTRPACDSPLSSEKRRAASQTRTIDTVSWGSTSLPGGGAPKATAPRDAACEAAPRVHRRLRRGWVRQWRYASLGRFARSEGTPSPPRTSREGGWEVPLLRSQSSTPWSSGGMGSEGWSPFRMTHRPRSPSRLPPRRGVPSRQPGCFPPSRNPARGGRCALATLIACSRLLVTRLFPTGGSLAIERCAPLFPLRTSTPAPDRGKRPKRLVVSRVRKLSLADPRPAAAPPKVSTTDSARGLLHRELPRRYIAHHESIAQQKNRLLFTFFIHSLPPRVLHQESPADRVSLFSDARLSTPSIRM